MYVIPFCSSRILPASNAKKSVQNFAVDILTHVSTIGAEYILHDVATHHQPVAHPTWIQHGLEFPRGKKTLGKKTPVLPVFLGSPRDHGKTFSDFTTENIFVLQYLRSIMMSRSIFARQSILDPAGGDSGGTTRKPKARMCRRRTHRLCRAKGKTETHAHQLQ